MTFPVVATTSSGTGGSTATAITMPSGVTVGDTLLVLFGVDGIPTITHTGTGWTQTTQAGTQASGAIFAKIADGSDTLTVNYSVAEVTGYFVLRITGAHASTVPAVTSAAAASAAPDSPTLSPSWGTADNMWVSFFSMDDGTKTLSTYPTNYNDNQLTLAGTTAGVRLGVATRELNASSQDPGAFATSASDSWVAFTIAVRPAGGGGGTVIESDLSVAGVGAGSFTSARVLGTTVASTGAATLALTATAFAAAVYSAVAGASASLVGASHASSVLSAGGTGAVSWDATSISSTGVDFIMEGTSTVTFTASSTAGAALTAAGAGAAAFTSASIAGTVLAASGAASSAFGGGALLSAAMSAAGSSSAAFTSGLVRSSSLASSGAGAAAFNSARTWAANLTAEGGCTVSLNAGSIRTAVLAATGTSTVSMLSGGIGGFITEFPIVAPYNPPLDEPYDPLFYKAVGGVAIGDGSQGRDVQLWTAEYDGTSVRIRNEAGVQQFSLPLPDVQALSFAFDGNMNVAIGYQTSTDSRLYYFNVLINAYDTLVIAGGTSCRCALDDNREDLQALSDIFFTYIREDYLYYRRQRDRYEVEYPIGQTKFPTILRLGMSTQFRLQWQLGEYTP